MMSLLHFGLYVIPEGRLYHAGSRLLGYDIRAGRIVEIHEFVQPHWTAFAAPYGFHASITDALQLEASRLPQVIRAVQETLNCFNKQNEYRFAVSKAPVFWGDDVLALELQPNRNVELLHDVLVARIHPLGEGSAYTSGAYRQDDPSAAHKVALFHSPYIFDAFRPHLTCLHPFTGSPEERAVVRRQVREVLDPPASLTMHRLTLVVKAEGETHYRIHTEFDLR
jgi:hypothetical protein